MFSGPKSRSGPASLALAAVLSLTVVSAEQAAAAPDEAIAAPITVRASNSAAQTAGNEFLTGFITMAIRFDGPKFTSCVATAVKRRPDLAADIVVSALNICRINVQPPETRPSFALVYQIVKAAVSAAPKEAPVIVRAAIKSESHARECIIDSAIAAAPDQEAAILAAAGETMPMSILPTAGRFNPKDNAPFGTVNSPEQPPAAP
jgi:hypothetical protein